MAIHKIVGKGTQAAIAQSIASPAVKAKSQTMIMVEELISIQGELDAIAASKLIKRATEIKTALQKEMTDSGDDKDQPYVFKTEAGTVEFGPCTNTTEIIDKALMIKLLTPKVFQDIAKVGITDLKDYLSGAEIESFTEKSRGSRSIKAVHAST